MNVFTLKVQSNTSRRIYLDQTRARYINLLVIGMLEGERVDLSDELELLDNRNSLL